MDYNESHEHDCAVKMGESTWTVPCVHSRFSSLKTDLSGDQEEEEKNYLVAFSRTERVRKLIHIPSLCPKIHSIMPA